MKPLTLLLVLIVLAIPTKRAVLFADTIALDTSVSGEAHSTTADLTLSITVASHANRLMIVNLVYYDAVPMTTATYNGSNLTAIAGLSPAYTGVAAYIGSVGYCVVAPATGTHDLFFSTGGTSNSNYFVTAAVYYNAQQSCTPDSSVVVGSTTSTSQTLSVTSVASGAWVLMGVGGNNTLSAGTGATDRGGPTGAAGFDETLLDSNGPVSPGSNSMQVLAASSVRSWAFSIAPSGGGGGATFNTAIINAYPPCCAEATRVR